MHEALDAVEPSAHASKMADATNDLAALHDSLREAGNVPMILRRTIGVSP